MVRIVLIDDEPAGLKMLERRLKDYPEAVIVGGYTDPVEGLRGIERAKPDVVFLDINMPELNGIDAVSQIRAIAPSPQVVFVTAHDKYAVKAFELEALDYLLKPVSRGRFARTFERVIPRIESSRAGEGCPGNPGPRLEIRTLGKFTISWTGSPALKWRSKKTCELAAFLVHNAGCIVSKDRLLETLWPEHNTDTASAQLYKNIHYIRKAFDEYGIRDELLSLRGKYLLEIGDDVKQDFPAFCKAVQTLSEHSGIAELEEAEVLYSGELLAGENGFWVLTERDRLSGLYHGVVLKLAESYLLCSRVDNAENLLLKAYGGSPGEGALVAALLNLYNTKQDRAKAAKLFARYTGYLDRELGVAPPEDVCMLLS